MTNMLTGSGGVINDDIIKITTIACLLKCLMKAGVNKPIVDSKNEMTGNWKTMPQPSKSHVIKLK